MPSGASALAKKIVASFFENRKPSDQNAEQGEKVTGIGEGGWAGRITFALQRRNGKRLACRPHGGLGWGLSKGGVQFAVGTADKAQSATGAGSEDGISLRKLFIPLILPQSRPRFLSSPESS